MTRDLTPQMQASIAEESGPVVVQLLSAEFSGGFVYLCTASDDIDWNGITWEAIGGSIAIGNVKEDPDTEQQGFSITLPAVDQFLVQKLLTEHFIGRPIELYRAHFDPSTGLVVPDPASLFSGEMNDGFKIVYDRIAGRAEIRARAVSRIGRSGHTKVLRKNQESHQAFFPDDTFYQFTAILASKKVSFGPGVPYAIYKRRDEGSTV